MIDKDCPQCKGEGLVADLPQFPKPAWSDWLGRPKAGPDPMTDFVKSAPCPRCFPTPEKQLEELKRLRASAVIKMNYHRAAELSEQIEEFDSSPASASVVEKLGTVVARPYQRDLAEDLRAKAVEYRKLAEQCEAVVTIAEQLPPGSDAERALIDLLKTQGVDL